MKGSRYIWLKNPWNLTQKQRTRLQRFERMNLKINRAYLLKERFRDLWSCITKPWAEKHLKQWFWWATHSRKPRWSVTRPMDSEPLNTSSKTSTTAWVTYQLNLSCIDLGEQPFFIG
ncbi:MAG: transposase [Proteobacteria bacterium]|nr:transposase [Pseudomonadota bacterium]